MESSRASAFANLVLEKHDHMVESTLINANRIKVLWLEKVYMLVKPIKFITVHACMYTLLELLSFGGGA